MRKKKFIEEIPDLVRYQMQERVTYAVVVYDEVSDGKSTTFGDRTVGLFEYEDSANAVVQALIAQDKNNGVADVEQFAFDFDFNKWKSKRGW